METTRSVAVAILPGDWAVSLDLRDAYLHVPVHPDYQHYLRFYFEGRVYQFKAMPFGLASAPLIFQSIVKAFVAPLHTLGLKLHFYLDGMNAYAFPLTPLIQAVLNKVMTDKVHTYQ
jgi:hypothetical protein